MAIIPRRSLLFMPATNRRALEKAANLPCDGVIIDLEDAVSPDMKIDARKAVCDALTTIDYSYRERIVRINSLDTDWWYDDLDTVLKVAPDAILIPKVENPEQVQKVADIIEAQSADKQPDIWAMIETPRAVIAAHEIAGTHPLLSAFVMGTNDLAKELHARHVPGRQPLLSALSTGLIAARANGLIAIDGVYNDIKNLEGFEAECQQGCDMGFDGKTLIHPNQIDATNTAFTADPDEVKRAQALKEAFDQAQSLGKGVATFEGRMIEALHVAEAERIIAFAAAIEDRE